MTTPKRPGIPRTPGGLDPQVYREFQRIVENLKWLNDAVDSLSSSVSQISVVQQAAQDEAETPVEEDPETPVAVDFTPDINTLLAMLTTQISRTTARALDVSGIVASQAALLASMGGLSRRITQLESEPVVAVPQHAGLSDRVRALEIAVQATPRGSDLSDRVRALETYVSGLR